MKFKILLYVFAKFQFVNQKLRNYLDLRGFKLEITNAVKYVLPNATIKVYKEYFIIRAKSFTNGNARAIGKVISKISLVLHSHIKSYYDSNNVKISGQLFRRVYTSRWYHI